MDDTASRAGKLAGLLFLSAGMLGCTTGTTARQTSLARAPQAPAVSPSQAVAKYGSSSRPPVRSTSMPRPRMPRPRMHSTARSNLWYGRPSWQMRDGRNVHRALMQ